MIRHRSRINDEVAPSASLGVWRVLVACLLLSACVSRPRIAAESDNCLTGETTQWTRLTAPPADADVLRSLSRSDFANPRMDAEERWYAAQDSLRYCRREDWCVAEAWSFARTEGGWRVVAHDGWVCVSSHRSPGRSREEG